MRLGLIAIFLLLPALAEAQPAALCSSPLSEEQLTTLVKGRVVPDVPIRRNLASCGIDFEPTEPAIDRLRSAGAPETVLAAVRAATGPAERLWESIKDSQDPAYFEDYLRRYPRGKSAAAAQQKYRDLSIQRTRGEIERALATSQWDVAEEKIQDLLRSVSEDYEIRAWQRQLADGREAERKKKEEEAAAAVARAAKDAVAAQAQAAVRCTSPLSEAQLTTLAKGMVPAARISLVVAACGIAFEPNDAALSRLRSAGSAAAVLDAVRAATRPPKVNPKDGLTYVWIPPGRFMMGCSLGDQECDDNERPAHEVTITKGFWLGQTPVTQQAYQRVTGQNHSHFRGADLPVETVDWNQAQAYCVAIGWRLPTEAEWEYAARAGSGIARYGNLDEIAWYAGNSGGTTHKVAQKLANAFGPYDMLGNVFEWVADWYGNYQPGAQSDPSGVASGQDRVLRGGSWANGSRFLRVSFRFSSGPGASYSSVGFRCAGE
jgi:formylglycine-generating enzyme required for sulfatase activity